MKLIENKDQRETWPRLLSVSEAARYLGLSNRTLYNQACRSYPGTRVPGRLELNGRVKYDRMVIDGWLDELAAEGQKDAPQPIVA